MEKPSSYCEYVKNLPEDNIHRVYHDTQYGFKIDSDNELFGRLILEINQAGLSWTTILNKQDNFRTAFSNFDIKKIADYGKSDISRLLANSGIVRNKLKINAVIFNARKIVELQKEYGSFKSWLKIKNDCNLNLTNWVALFKENFKFTGNEITKEFLTSTGYIKGAHIETCPILDK
ncbi:MAG: DNA-3-methyladenine glycosylase I [Pelagibacterales bacterium]|nr:DNA-3-methyladenine glycosylase I [Pelagibacterales bacterium]